MAGLIVATFEHVSGLPEDRITNSFAISGSTADLASAQAAIELAFDGFYNELAGTQVTDIANRISGVVDRTVGVHTLACYDISNNLDGSPHGSPVWAAPFTLDAGSGQGAMPSEVAIVLRFEASGRAEAAVEVADGVDADSLPDRPKQRHTGRIYLGPLATNVHDNSPGTTGENRPTAQVRTDITQAAKGLDAALRAEPLVSLALAVWSRKDQVIRTLEAVSVDDAFDTQRRRGVAPTAVTRVTVP